MADSSTADLGNGRSAFVAGDEGPGVVVLQEYWGLVPQIIDVAQRLAAHGFTTVVPDLYRGESTDDRTRAAELMMSLDPHEAIDHTLSSLDWLRERAPGAAVLGFCMGGGLALAVTASNPSSLDACVCCYGFVPWRELAPAWGAVHVPLQLHFAGQDTFATPSSGERIADEVNQHGGHAEFHLYPEAQHAFMDDTRAESHHPVAAAVAWDRTVRFLHQHASTDGTGDAT